MSRVRVFFVLFSLLVLAAPASAQGRGKKHEHEKKHEHDRRERGSERERDKRAESEDDDDDRDERKARHDDDDDDRDERKARHDDDDDDRDENRKVERSGRRDHDEDEDEDDDDDDRRITRNGSGCTDRNGNDVCGISNGRIPATLPEMINAVMISRGQLTPLGSRWVGRGGLTPRFTSVPASRSPSRVTWLDANGRVSQLWLDRNRDGRADVVSLYRAGRLVKTIRR